MRNTNKIFSLIFGVLLVAFVISGCSSASSSEKSSGNKDNYTLSLGHLGTQGHSWHVTLLEFAEAVKEESDGRLSIEIFPDGQLGGNTEMIQQIQMGDLDMAIIGGSSHSPIIPEMGIENLPFVFETHKDAYEVMDGELGNKLLEMLESKGIVGLAWWEDGFFQITNNLRPIHTPDDLNGLKIRVPEIELRQDTFKALGASPVPMSFTELFSSLQQGVVDGQTNAATIVQSSKFNEVQEYLSIANLTWSSALMDINKDTWNSLPDDLQTILKDNAVKFRDIQRERIQDENETIIGELEESGMKVNYIDDLTPFIEASQTVYDKYNKVFGEDLMKLIKK